MELKTINLLKQSFLWERGSSTPFGKLLNFYLVAHGIILIVITNKNENKVNEFKQVSDINKIGYSTRCFQPLTVRNKLESFSCFSQKTIEHLTRIFD